MNPNDTHTSYETLIIKYLSGQATPQEVEQLELWVKSDDANKAHFRQYRQAWNLSGYRPEMISGEKNWEKLQAKLFEEQQAASSPTIFRTLLSSKTFRLAATVALLVVTVFSVYYLVQPSRQELAALDNPVSGLLADGTEVELNHGSKITYPGQFSSKERRVKLQGDAFFNVVADPEKPFIIETKDITIQVLGTSFYVNAPLDAPVVEVVVKTGRVAMISPLGDVLELSAGQKGIYNRNQGRLQRMPNTDPNYISWKTRRIEFEDTDLRQVAFTLSKTYQVKVELKNPELANCRLTATFSHQSLDEILTVIEDIFGISASRQGNTVILSGNACK